jgi:hypothetical protein
VRSCRRLGEGRCERTEEPDHRVETDEKREHRRVRSGPTPRGVALTGRSAGVVVVVEATCVRPSV